MTALTPVIPVDVARRRLVRAQQKAAQWVDPLFDAVDEARRARMTWAEIADSLGMAVGTVINRYGGGIEGHDQLLAEARERARRRPPRPPVPAPSWPGMSVAEAGEKLGVSAETVRRWIAQGNPAVEGEVCVDSLGRRSVRVLSVAIEDREEAAE